MPKSNDVLASIEIIERMKFTGIWKKGRLIALIPHHNKWGVNRKNVRLSLKVNWNVRKF